MHKTKIVATVGPASSSKEMLTKLIKSGVNLFRINMSHEADADLLDLVKLIRSINTTVGIIVDLQGPRIRTGRLKDKKAMLIKGAEFIITSKQVEGNQTMVSTDYKDLPNEVKPGQAIFINNGLLELQVTKVAGSDIHCIVKAGGILLERKGMNLPGVSIFKKALTEKDIVDIEYAVKAEVDYIAVSFIKNADDVLEAKKVVQDKGANIPIIAKIENPDALKMLDSIISVADAVMVARGDLGVELPPEEVPMIQKDIVKSCTKHGKPVIVASQMLESMVESPLPTRAEATDIANAILDGADAVMLSEETASGLYPVKAVEVMERIISRTEEDGVIAKNLGRNDIKTNIAYAVSHSAFHVCEDLKASAIITFTTSGSTALMASKWRPKAPIYAPVTSEKAARKVSLYWGVKAIQIAKYNDTDSMIENAEKALVTQGGLKSGDVVVITAGVPVGITGTTNLLKVQKIT